jgi:hypothetical protein
MIIREECVATDYAISSSTLLTCFGAWQFLFAMHPQFVLQISGEIVFKIILRSDNQKTIALETSARSVKLKYERYKISRLQLCDESEKKIRMK